MSEVLSLIAIIFSGMSVIFVALSYRKSMQPRLRIEIKDRENKEIQNCLEWKNLFLHITNVSKNTANSIKIELTSEVNVKGEDKKIILKSKEKISYLHPKESSHFPIKSIYDIHTKLNELFEIKERKSEEMKVPKEDLIINLRVEVSSRNFWSKYKTYDDFYIEWKSMKSSPQWHSPRILCWNKRKDKFVVKRD